MLIKDGEFYKTRPPFTNRGNLYGQDKKVVHNNSIHLKKNNSLWQSPSLESTPKQSLLSVVVVSVMHLSWSSVGGGRTFWEIPTTATTRVATNISTFMSSEMSQKVGGSAVQYDYAIISSHYAIISSHYALFTASWHELWFLLCR